MNRPAGVTAWARQLTAAATPGDVFLAAGTALVQVGASAAIAGQHGRPISLTGYLLLAAGPAALLVRRHFPAAVWWVTVAAAVGFAALEPARGLPYLALIIAFVNVVLAGRRWAAITGLVVSYLGILWLPGLTGTGHFPAVALALGVAAWHLTLLSGAEWYRGRRQRAAALAQGEQEAERAGPARNGCGSPVTCTTWWRTAWPSSTSRPTRRCTWLTSSRTGPGPRCP